MTGTSPGAKHHMDMLDTMDVLDTWMCLIHMGQGVILSELGRLSYKSRTDRGLPVQERHSANAQRCSLHIF